MGSLDVERISKNRLSIDPVVVNEHLIPVILSAGRSDGGARLESKDPENSSSKDTVVRRSHENSLPNHASPAHSVTLLINLGLIPS